MRKWHWVSLGIVIGLLLAAGFGFARPGQPPDRDARNTFAGQPIRHACGHLSAKMKQQPF